MFESIVNKPYVIIVIFLPVVLCVYFISRKIKSKQLQGIVDEPKQKIIPKSVNYHFTRKCNYSCGFCFHTAKTSYMLELDVAKNGLEMLKKAGMEKVNFSGGEPFLPKRGRHLGQMVEYCKKELQLSVTIISNGSLITEEWFKEFGRYVDIMAVSCDSFYEDTNRLIGRGQGKNSNHLSKILQVKEWCEKYEVLFKINTVVNTYNKDEDMRDEIERINPVRWKVFQCLLLEGENAGPDALRNAERFYIDKSTFERFLERHSGVGCLVPESNEKMKDSYLILDEYMRFLDCTSGSKIPSKSILDVGVDNALKFSGFDEVMFKKRGGFYKWSKQADRYSW